MLLVNTFTYITKVISSSIINVHLKIYSNILEGIILLKYNLNIN